MLHLYVYVFNTCYMPRALSLLRDSSELGSVPSLSISIKLKQPELATGQGGRGSPKGAEKGMAGAPSNGPSQPAVLLSSYGCNARSRMDSYLSDISIGGL